MGIQIRRGKKKDFDPDKMLPGEWAGTTDTKEVFFTFAPGDTKKMATYEDMEENIREATGEITAGLTEGISTAIEQANAAAETANQAAETAQASITDLTEDVAAAIENSNTASNAATQAAKEAQDAAQEAREAAGGIGSVTGVKGNKETEYRQGNINLTPEDLGALSTTGDAGSNTVTFTSNDSGPDGDPAVLEVEKLTSGETLFSILQKVSRIFTNFRYLLRLAGTTDISVIGDGTITGAIAALQTALTTAGKNTAINLTISSTSYFEGTVYVEKKGNCARLQLGLTLIKGMTAWSSVTVTTIPSGYRPTNGVSQYVKLNSIDAMIGVGTNGKVTLQAFQDAACNFIQLSILYLI